MVNNNKAVGTIQLQIISMVKKFWSENKEFWLQVELQWLID